MRRVPWYEYLDATEELRAKYFVNLVAPVEAASDKSGTLPLRIEHFLERHAEYIVLTGSEDETLGWFEGEMLDFETFYMRNAALVPQVRGTGLARAAFRDILTYLQRLGYSRFTSHQLASNNAALVTVLQEGFFVSGVTVDERFGVHVDTLYLADEGRRAEAVRLFSGLPSAAEGKAGRRLDSPAAGKSGAAVAATVKVRPYDARALTAALARDYEIRAFESGLNGAWVTLAHRSDSE
jgi:GNAT superfamily N-acetyltransferase